MNDFEDSFFEEEPTEFDTYSFYYTDSDGNRDIEAHIQLPYDCQWTTALEHYLDFLSNIYGYDIRDQVAVRFKPHRGATAWSGPVFDLSVQEREKYEREVGLGMAVGIGGNYGGSE